MSNKSSIAVCVPVFNGEETIAATLESIYSQTSLADEVIVVDNASTDKTLEIAAQFETRGAKVYTSDANKGFNVNFNRAVRLASSKYITILSADDILYPDYCEKMSSSCSSFSKVVFGFCAVELINENGEHVGTQSAMHDPGLVSGEEFIEEALLRRHAVCLSSVLFDREHLLDAGGFDERYTNSDYILQLLMASKGDVYYSAEKMAAYRIIANCTGEVELYGHANLLTRKMDMLNGAFQMLDKKYGKYRKQAEARWVKFVMNFIMFAAVRYGRVHAIKMTLDVVKNRFYYIMYPRLVTSFIFSALLPKSALVKLLQFAASLLGKDGAAIHRALNTNQE
jgi:glycosyltransferase involved in cell wall biosynthesis